MFELVVLVETALAAVRLSTNFDTTFVISLNLVGIASHSFAFLIIFVTLTTLFILDIKTLFT